MNDYRGRAMLHLIRPSQRKFLSGGFILFALWQVGLIAEESVRDDEKRQDALGWESLRVKAEAAPSPEKEKADKKFPNDMAKLERMLTEMLDAAATQKKQLVELSALSLQRESACDKARGDLLAVRAELEELIEKANGEIAKGRDPMRWQSLVAHKKTEVALSAANLESCEENVAKFDRERMALEVKLRALEKEVAQIELHIHRLESAKPGEGK